MTNVTIEFCYSCVADNVAGVPCPRHRPQPVRRVRFRWARMIVARVRMWWLVRRMKRTGAKFFVAQETP